MDEIPEIEGWATLADGSRVKLSKEECRAIIEGVEAAQAKAERDMPDEATALQVMSGAHHRLRDFGWRDAVYCPKDGTMFEVIEAGSCGIHLCHYEGEWPKGSWWIHADGDQWPSRPILFRLIKEPEPDMKEVEGPNGD